MADEPKIASRQRTFLKGTLYYDNRRASIECVVRDVSDSGARLTFDHPATIPDSVELFIPSKQQTLRARVRRRAQMKSELRSMSLVRSNHGAPPTPNYRSASKRWKRKSLRSSDLLLSSRPRFCRSTLMWRRHTSK